MIKVRIYCEGLLIADTFSNRQTIKEMESAGFTVIVLK